MKNLKVSLFLLGMVVAFVACQQSFDDDVELAENEMRLAAMNAQGRISASEMLVPEYMPLNVIPEWAQEKMTQEEYEMWQFIGSIYKVDYSFLNAPYYTLHKETINKQIQEYSEAIKNGEIDEQSLTGCFSVICPSSLALNSIEQLSDPEGGNVDKFKDRRLSVQVAANGPVSVEYFLIYGYAPSLPAGERFIVMNESFVAHPAGAKFKGATHSRIDYRGVLSVTCAGTVEYKDEEYPVSNTVTMTMPID